MNYSNIRRKPCKHVSMLEILFYVTYHLDNKPIIIIIIICKYESMQVCNVARVQVGKYASMHEYKIASIQV